MRCDLRREDERKVLLVAHDKVQLTAPYLLPFLSSEAPRSLDVEAPTWSLFSRAIAGVADRVKQYYTIYRARNGPVCSFFFCAEFRYNQVWVSLRTAGCHWGSPDIIRDLRVSSWLCGYRSGPRVSSWIAGRFSPRIAVRLHRLLVASSVYGAGVLRYPAICHTTLLPRPSWTHADLQ